VGFRSLLTAVSVQQCTEAKIGALDGKALVAEQRETAVSPSSLSLPERRWETEKRGPVSRNS